jgi:hypothetical protein
MAYAEAPAARPLVISVAAPPPLPMPPPFLFDERSAAAAAAAAAVEEVAVVEEQQQQQEQEDATFPPSEAWRPLPHHLSPEALWLRVREESKADAVRFYICFWFACFGLCPGFSSHQLSICCR